MTAVGESGSPVVYTIGHSNYSIDALVKLLRLHAIEVVADVRSSPYSKYSPQFNTDVLKSAMKNAGFAYLFLGKEVGGRPDDLAFYDPAGHVLYSKLAESKLFRDGIERLLNGIGKYRVAMMCSEEDPTDCHRRLLISRVLAQRGIEVIHIRGDGRLQPERELAAELKRQKDDGQQLLFDVGEEQWRSTRPF